MGRIFFQRVRLLFDPDTCLSKVRTRNFTLHRVPPLLNRRRRDLRLHPSTASVYCLTHAPAAIQWWLSRAHFADQVNLWRKWLLCRSLWLQMGESFGVGSSLSLDHFRLWVSSMLLSFQSFSLHLIIVSFVPYKMTGIIVSWCP